MRELYIEKETPVINKILSEMKIYFDNKCVICVISFQNEHILEFIHYKGNNFVVNFNPQYIEKYVELDIQYEPYYYKCNTCSKQLSQSDIDIIFNHYKYYSCGFCDVQDCDLTKIDNCGYYSENEVNQIVSDTIDNYNDKVSYLILNSGTYIINLIIY